MLTTQEVKRLIKSIKDIEKCVNNGDIRSAKSILGYWKDYLTMLCSEENKEQLNARKTVARKSVRKTKRA